VHVCPACKSDSVYRSRTRSGWERWRRQVTLKAPFRCQSCGRRFWRPDPGPWFSREEIDAANRAIASALLDETIAVPPVRSTDPSPIRPEDLKFDGSRRLSADPEIAALDARFSRPKPEVASYELRFPEGL
jgi:hypothetical protein